MAPMNGKTRTIKIYDTTKERLTHYRLPTETWDDMVIRLMNYWDTGIKPEYHPHPTKHTILIGPKTVDKVTLTKGFDKIANSEFIRIQVTAGATTYGHTIYEKHHQGGWQDLINEGYTDMSDLKFKDPDDE